MSVQEFTFTTSVVLPIKPLPLLVNNSGEFCVGCGLVRIFFNVVVVVEFFKIVGSLEAVVVAEVVVVDVVERFVSGDKMVVLDVGECAG